MASSKQFFMFLAVATLCVSLLVTGASARKVTEPLVKMYGSI